MLFLQIASIILELNQISYASRGSCVNGPDMQKITSQKEVDELVSFVKNVEPEYVLNRHMFNGQDETRSGLTLVHNLALVMYVAPFQYNPN